MYLSELRVFVVVCVTFQKVSEVCELRLTEEECEDFCCHVKAAVVYRQTHAEEVAQLCVCVCVFYCVTSGKCGNCITFLT